MKSMILAIRLKYFYLTYKGIKTLEIRKTVPKDFVGVVYEYVSKTNFEKELQEIPENEREFFKQFKGKVGLKFTLRKVEEIFTPSYITEDDNDYSCDIDELLKQSCLTEEELTNYIGEDNYHFFTYHIEDLVIFDKPKELSEFSRYHEKKDEHSACWTCKRFGTGCMSCKLTKAPQSYCFVESEE